MSLTPRISEMFISLIIVIEFMHHHTSVWVSCRFHWKWSFLEQVSGSHFINVAHKLVTEAGICCITKHVLLEFPTGIFALN